MSDYTPSKSDKFTFGLWTVGNPGRDPFGDAVRPKISAVRIVEKLAELGAYGVNLHDNDLIPFDATPSERDKIVSEFKKALQDHDMKVPMATTNLFTHPVFKDGAFTSSEPEVREFALQKTMRGIDLGIELGAKIYVFWGGREGSEVEASKNPMDAIKRFRESMNFLCEYCRDNKYDLKFALEAKPNEPRGDIYLATTGSMLHFISTLDHSEMVGVNPELGHEQMSGLNFTHVVAEALEAGKLFHIDLNAQKGPRFDQDMRFGSEDSKGAFFLVRILEESGWQGSRHFDSHAYRTEDEAGVWEFAKGSMRNYLILKEKVKRFGEDKEIQGLISNLNESGESAGGAANGKYSSARARELKERKIDYVKLGSKGREYERLDQLVMDLIYGVR